MDEILDTTADARVPPEATGRRISSAVWAYLVVAALTLGAGLVALSAPSPVAGVDFFGPLSVLAGIGLPLAGAAFHARHRDAWSAHRPIALALAFFALGAVVYPLSAGLLLYGWLAAAVGVFSWLDWSVGFRLVTDISAIVATGLLWVGVRRSRRAPDVAGGRATRLAIWLLVAVLMIGSLAAGLSNLRSGSLGAQVLGLEGLVAGLFRAILGGALTVALVKGSRAGERPCSAWWLLGGTRVALLAGTLLAPLLARVLELAIPGPAAYILLGEIFTVIGSAGFLAGFVLGWPSDHREPVAAAQSA